MDRKELISCLNEQWGMYRSRFENLSQGEQQAFLERQGYASLADLLAHVAAWWARGMGIIENLLIDPGYQSPPVNVDEFNAAVVAGVAGLPAQMAFDHFEEVRQQLLVMINQLNDEQLNLEKVARQFDMELIGHYQEHKI